jgi:hypothetical protein
MSDDALPLGGEKVTMVPPQFSGGSPWAGAASSALGLVRAAAGWRESAIWAALSFCGAIGYWAAPALLLHRYPASQLLDALVGSSVRGSNDELFALFLLLAYVVASGLLVGSTTARLARRLGWAGVALRLATAPLIALSLAATMAAAIPLFIGVLIRCFPALL